MTDNYQIDKNSKLFQKFLNLKNNKAAEPISEKPSHQESNSSVRGGSGKARQTSHIPEHVNIHKNNEKTTLHVTIGDIEEAASMSFHQENHAIQRNNTRYMSNEHSQTFNEKAIPKEEELPLRQQFETTMKQQYYSSRPLEFSKPERPRQRRARDFNDKNRGRNERSFRLNESLTETPSIKTNQSEVIVRQDQSKKQKQNQMSLNQEQQITVREENTFTLGSREGQYKKKYDKLHEKYEELKETLQKQRKQRQQEINDKDAENELIREKYFQLRSNEDSLTSDLKRLKQKLQSQNMIRTKYEQEVKELTFKINEMEDMLDGKENGLKKKSDEANHWKAYSEQLKGELKAYNAEIEKLQDRCQYLESQNKMIKKDIQNKENLIEQLRKNINRLIEENNIAKDEIYKLTIRSYQFEQQNQIIKGDLIRRNRQQPQMNAIQENFMRSIQSLSPKRRQNRTQKPDRIIERQERPQRGQKEPIQGNNRRRQFARERAVTSKPQRQQRPERQQRREQRKLNTQNNIERRQEAPIQRRTEPPVPKHNREAIARIQFLQSQLDKRKQQKAMNGKLRREKIEMERELQQLLTKINQ